jgi:hypothetical protein
MSVWRCRSGWSSVFAGVYFVVTINAAVQGQGASHDAWQYKTAFALVNEKAVVARNGDELAARALIDEILDHFSPVLIPSESSVRNRMSHAESEFRRGLRKPVPELHAMIATNELFGKTGMSWGRTNLEQLRLFRTMLKPLLPQVIGAVPLQKKRGPPWELSDQMSPAEAILVTFYLARGKLSMPEYQVDPDQWVRTMREETARVGTSKKGERSLGSPPSLRRTVVKADRSAALHAIEQGLADPKSEVFRQVEAFLEWLGMN